jgi:hypothetical protein
MRARSALVAVCVVATLSMMGASCASAGASGSGVHDGVYTNDATDASGGYAKPYLTVVDNGTKILGGAKNSSVNCTTSTSLASQNPNTIDSITIMHITIPTLPVSAAGTFSFSGNAEVITLDSPSQTFTLPMTVSGRIVKGKIVAKKTTAAVVTFSSPSICAAETPTRFLLKWYP